MSHNIRSSKIVAGSLTIQREKALAWADREDDLPEISPLDDLNMAGDPKDEIRLPHFWWYGEGSCGTYPEIIEEFAADLKGEADILFIWESGEVSGIRIKNGKATEHQVIMSFGNPQR